MSENNGAAARTLEWFLRIRALRAAHDKARSETATQRKYRRIARVALELGDRSREVMDFAGPSCSLPVQCELYREASYWALVSQDAAVTAPPSYEALWESPLAIRLRAGQDAASEGSLRESLVASSFVDFGMLPVEEQEKRVRVLAAFAHALRPLLDDPEEVVEELQQQRMWRLGIPLVVLAIVAFVAAPRIAEWNDERRDLAAGRPWRASSQWFKCQPEEERCEDFHGTRVFFHTREEQGPWLEIDLGKQTAVSQVDVLNRSDCCAERAVPLVVEVSPDRNNFRPLARRDTVFDRWVADFPATKARYVRLRLDAKGILHLERVRVYR